MNDGDSLLPDVVKIGMQYLGKGYRGYEYYADPRSCTVSMFNLSRTGDVEVLAIPDYESVLVTGDTVEDYSRKLSAGLSLPGDALPAGCMFLAEIKTTFAAEILSNVHNTFVTVHDRQIRYRLRISGKAMPTEEAARDLRELPPDALLEKYGTHYLKSICIGGRVSFSSYVDRSTLTEKLDLTASANLAFEKTVKGDASKEGKSDASAAEK